MSIHKNTTPVILAGGRIDPEFGAFTGVSHTSQLMFQGQTILERTLHAIKQSGLSNKPILVSSLHDPDEDRYSLLPDQGDLADNVLAALYVAPTKRIVTISTDLPLITASVISELLTRMSGEERRLKREIDFCYSVSEVSRCDVIMPGMKHTAMTFKEGGSYTGGNIMLVSKDAVADKVFVEKVLKARKSKRDLSKLIIKNGICKHPIAVAPFMTMVLKGMKKVQGKPLATRAFPFEKMGSLVSAFTGVKCAVVQAAPQIACDIDSLESWHLLLEHHPEKVLH